MNNPLLFFFTLTVSRNYEKKKRKREDLEKSLLSNFRKRSKGKGERKGRKKIHMRISEFSKVHSRIWRSPRDINKYKSAHHPIPRCDIHRYINTLTSRKRSLSIVKRGVRETYRASGPMITIVPIFIATRSVLKIVEFRDGYTF